VRTWNLSCLLHAETGAGRVWIKAVPPFMAHEPRLLGLLAEDSPVAVPPLVAAAPGVSLLEDVGGRDLYDAGFDELVAMVDALVLLQTAWAGRPDDLLHAGLADRRGSALTAALAAFTGRADVRGRLEADECAALDRLVDCLPDRFAAAAACGIPETLVHGDFHPGNWRTDGSRMTLLDWGDASLGHPTIDIATFAAAVERYGAAPDAVGPVRRVWVDAWHRAVPGCEPERAASLLGPVAALERALVFRQFLDGIEASEAPYHARDTEEWIRRALDAARAG
jgi:Ser/Thr protein kinase RdoA (MazF antagonist)